MVLTTKLFALLLAIMLLPQCAYQSAPQSGSVTGPFDSRGNYIEDWVNSPEKWYRPASPGIGSKKTKTTVAKKKVQSTNQVAVQTRPNPVVVKPKPTAKPKPKPKPKPSFTYHKVRRGDTLSGLARRYGTSVSRIKQSNRISGTVIRLGETLKIPR